MPIVNTLLVERREEGTALITIKAPGRPGAMNRALHHDLTAALAELDGDPEIGACVITGAGEAFSSGMHAEGCIVRASTVTIAAVNGLAFAGGAEMTLACDHAVASSRARFAFREVVPGGLRRAGRALTRRRPLGGEEIDAEQARRIGLVERIVAPERLIEESLALAGRIAAGRSR